jgi:hypothetical protein
MHQRHDRIEPHEAEHTFWLFASRYNEVQLARLGRQPFATLNQ